MKDKISTYHTFKKFFDTHKLRTEEDFTKGSVFMDVYDFQTYLFAMQIRDNQIGIATKIETPFEGANHVFSTEKDAKEFIKLHLGFSNTIIAENKSEATKIENTKSRVYQTGKLIAVGT